MGAPRSREIVGVVGDVRPTSFDAPARAELFVPYEQTSDGGPTFVVETEGPTAAAVPALREVVAAFDPGQAIYHSGTVEEMIAGTLVARRFNTLLLGLLSLVAVGLATVGVYGLISFGVNARTAEIGVRMALGAQRGELVRMIVVGALRLALLGIALGIAAALVFTRFLEGMLYGVEAADPLTFVQLALAMLLASALAAWLPARRASRLPPVTALRE
jgi:predicted lysophospholipase L1 biosynthesis ABC-type transport system permease subunit